MKYSKTSEWPWERKPYAYMTHQLQNVRFEPFSEKSKFYARSNMNSHHDKTTKIAALTASASVVSLVAYSDNEELRHGTGTIIGEDGTLFTSTKLVTCPTTKNVVANKLKVIVNFCGGKSYEAEMLAHDFHYGIAVLRIQEDVPLLKPACLRLVDDCINLDPDKLLNQDNKEPLLRRHSNTYNLIPGDKVIVLARYFIEPYDLMVAPGNFSIKWCEGQCECEELLRSTCLTTPICVGGPIINRFGEVIGIATRDDVFTRSSFTGFLPINIALKWWELYKKSGNIPVRPLLGMRMANFYTAPLQVMERLNQKFPSNFTGVIVEKVDQGSSAEIVGICPDDLIIGCCGENIRGFLELYDMMWDKIGGPVELVVLRPGDDAPLHFIMDVVGATNSATNKKRKRIEWFC